MSRHVFSVFFFRKQHFNGRVSGQNFHAVDAVYECLVVFDSRYDWFHSIPVMMRLQDVSRRSGEVDRLSGRVFTD